MTAFPEVIVHPARDFRPLPPQLAQQWLSESAGDATFERRPHGFAWISDIEHVVMPIGKEPAREYPKEGPYYMASAKPATYMCGATIPAGRYFELFPYHYYAKEEEQLLGGRISYKLIAVNRTDKPVTLQISGQGTTCDWDHFKAWEGALRGDKKQTIVIQPGQTATLWEERALEGDLPWSGIFLGCADGDLWVCDYTWYGEKDPGIAQAEQMPDLALPPTLWPSYTRGTADWIAADVYIFPKRRDATARLPLSKVPDGVYSFAFAASPGGPLDKPCEYMVRPNTFKDDTYPVTDPLSGQTHLFFGGNYPVMYEFALPLANDTASTRTVEFFLCSNDKLKVDTLAGVWMQGKMMWRRVPMVGNNSHWNVWSATLAPGAKTEARMTIVPLGSRWGGMIGSLAVSAPGPANKAPAEASQPAKPVQSSQ